MRTVYKMTVDFWESRRVVFETVQPVVVVSEGKRNRNGR